MSEPPKSGEEALEPVYPISGPNMDISLWDGEFEYYTPNVFKAKGRVNARLLPSPSTRIVFESNSRYGMYPYNKPGEELRLGPIGTTKSKDRVMLHLTSFHSDEDGTGIHCEGELTRDILTNIYNFSALLQKQRNQPERHHIYQPPVRQLQLRDNGQA